MVWIYHSLCNISGLFLVCNYFLFVFSFISVFIEIELKLTSCVGEDNLELLVLPILPSICHHVQPVTSLNKMSTFLYRFLCECKL